MSTYDISTFLSYLQLISKKSIWILLNLLTILYVFVRELRLYTVYSLVQKKGPVLLNTSQAEPGRTFTQLSDLSFARPCINFGDRSPSGSRHWPRPSPAPLSRRRTRASRRASSTAPINALQQNIKSVIHWHQWHVCI